MPARRGRLPVHRRRRRARVLAVGALVLAAAAVTAAGGPDRPAVAARDLAANRRGLDGAAVRARLLDLREDGDTARARVAVEWRVPAIGRWAYESAMTLRRRDDRWAVAWTPTVVHP